MQKQEINNKVYKGVFISNERKKKQGGRIKCPDLPNKVEVYNFNPAIHESEVQWVEVRRFKRQNQKNKEKEKRKDTPQPQSQEKKRPSITKPPKFTQKKEETMEKKQSHQDTANKQEKNQESPSKKQEISPQIQQKKASKRPKYVLKEEKQQKQAQNSQTKKVEILQKKTQHEMPEIKEKITTKDQEINNKQEIKEINTSTDKEIQSESHKQTEDPSKIETQVSKQEEQPPKGEEERKQNESESEESQSEDEYKDLQIIVGRVKRQTSILYKTKPFVAIMDFFQKRKKNQKKKKEIKDPIEQIFEDFNVDILPIHARLPRMEMDQLVPENIKMLSQYAINVLKFDPNKKKKQELNRILDALSNTYIFVTFSDWDGEYPLAKIHKILGKALTIDGECERFLYEHGLNDFHYEQQIQQKKPLQLQPTQLHKKLDRMIFTIDPPTSTDLDDALSIEQKGNLYQIGIHIADVSSYLHMIERSEIVKRTTSVYLPYKVYHMLQSQLVKICSLDPGMVRLAFTVWVTMDVEGNVIGQGRIQKNIIKSRFKLSYQVVQNLITNQMSYQQFNQKYPCQQQEYDNLLEKLCTLAQIANAHRKQRILFDVFENKELQFKSDQSRWPIECFIDKRFAAKKMVEEYMIIGNIESARLLVKAQPNNALVIHHPKPTKLAVNSFNDQFKVLQTKFKFQSVLDMQKQLLELQANKKVAEEIKQVCYFRARRVMEPAIYRKYNQIVQEEKDKAKEKNKKENQQIQNDKKTKEETFPVVHFALGLQFYTHFTSPMRRMADILVHEVLTKILEGKEPQPLRADEIQKINAGRRSTKRLKKDLNQVYLCLMIYHTKKSLETEGIISSFGMESVSIYIPLFDMQKEVLWKKQFKIHSIRRLKQNDRLNVKLKHDKFSAKDDVYWVMKKFQKVKLTLGCTKNPPLRLTVEMEVQSQKGPFKIQWLED